MKNTKINLLVNREDYRRLERLFFWLRGLVVFLLIIFFGILMVFLTTLMNQNKTIKSLFEQKKILLQSLKDKEAYEAKVSYLEKKYSFLKEFLKDDAQTLPYYNLLNSALSLSTQSAQLRSFKIDKNRHVDFTVIFNNFSEMMAFFKFIESEKFIKNFENIILKSFSISIGEQENESYELSFTGRFIPLNETKN